MSSVKKFDAVSNKTRVVCDSTRPDISFRHMTHLQIIVIFVLACLDLANAKFRINLK